MPPVKSKVLNYWFLLLSAVTLFTLHFNGFSSNDFWIQAAVGDYIWKNFSLPETAMYPFTIARDYPFLAHEWFASTVMSFIASWSGDGGIGYAVAKLIIGVILFNIIYITVRARGTNLQLTLMLATVVSVFLSFRLTLRAENLAFLFFAAFVYTFHQFLQSRKSWNLAVLFLITLTWVNTHGSFVVAFVYVTIYLVVLILDRRKDDSKILRKPIFWLLIAMLLASLINPYGFQIFESAAHISTSTYMKTFIAEWQPPFSSAFIKTPSFYFYLCYLVITLLIVGKSFRQISMFDRLVFVAFAILSLLALRHVVYFYLATVPILATLINLYKPPLIKRISICLAGLLVINFTFVVVEGNYIQVKVGSKFEAPLDLDTIQWLRKQSYKGSVFNSYTLGDQLAYNFFPEMRVVIDSRTDLYGEDYIKRYQQTIYQDDEFLQFLSGNQIKLIIVTNEDFRNYFQKSPNRLEHLQKVGWKIGFRSQDNFVLTLGGL